MILDLAPAPVVASPPVLNPHAGLILDARTAVEFGRYDNRGKLVERVVSHVDVETGALLEPVELDPGVWLVLWPGGILGTTPLVVTRRTAFDSLVPL